MVTAVSALPSSTSVTPTSQPVRKVTVGILAGAIVTVLIWILKQFGHINVASEVSTACTTIFTFVISYLTPPAPNETTVKDATGSAKSATNRAA